jgi:MFS family permease
VSGRSGVAGRVVIAVDPHKRSWTAAAVDGSLRLQPSIRVEANRDGYRELRRLAACWPASRWAIEGAGGLGAPLATQLLADGLAVADVNAAGILGVIASVVLVELVGRRWFIGVAAPLMAVALLGFSLVLQGQTATILMIAIFGFLSLVVVPTMYAYVAELYPTEIRASGFGWASSSSRNTVQLR